MQLVRATDREFIPASHENPTAPGVWKKVLFAKDDLQVGHVQMINWARLPAGSRFANHLHEDMQEIFILVEGEAELTVAAETVTLRRGDGVVIDPREVHEMRNAGADDVEYLALGITSEAGGKTVVVEEILH